MLFSALLPLAAVSWMFTATAMVEPPRPPPTTIAEAAARAVAEVERRAESDTVDVVLFDQNHPETRTLPIGRDGNVDEATRTELERLFRCKRTERHRSIDQGLLAMLADVAAHYPGHTIEFVSAYRASDRHTSRHYQGRALDFRVKGVPILEVRDYVWANHHELGLGWYPAAGFLHMDHRIDDADIAWTEINGVNHYHPTWSKRVRRGLPLAERASRVGL